MIRTLYRLLFVLFLVAGALRGSAQNVADVALWIVDPELSESTVVGDGDSTVADFDEEVGYAISFNRFWTPSFSTEIALQQYSAEMNVTPEGDETREAGTLDVTSLTVVVQWHFNRDGWVSPYVGGGLARVAGELDLADDVLDPAPERISLEAEITWTVAAGANVRLTERIVLVGEVKYIPWNARERNGSQVESLEIDPTTFAAGLRWRF